PVQLTAASFAAMLTTQLQFWQNSRAISRAGDVGASTFDCVITQTHRPVPSMMLRPNHLMITGVHAPTGLPRIQAGVPNLFVASTLEPGVLELVHLLNNIAPRTYEYNGITRRKEWIPGTGNGQFRIVTGASNGPPVFASAYFTFLGFFLGSMNELVYAYTFVHATDWDNARTYLAIRPAVGSTACNALIPFRKSPAQNINFPADRVNGLNMTLAPTNTLTDATGVINAVNGIAGVTASDDPIVTLIPLVIPEAFPNVSADAWPSFAQTLQNSLTRPDVILSYAEASVLLATNDVPNVVIDIDVPSLPPFPDIDFSGIMALLRSILDVLRWIPGATIAGIAQDMDRLRTVSEGVRTAIQGIRADLSEHRDAIIIQILAGVNPALAGIYQAVIALDGFSGIIEGLRTTVQGIRADLSEHRDAIIIQILAGINPALAGIYQTVIALDGVSGVIDGIRTAVQGLRTDLSEHRDAIIIQILAGINPALAGIYQTVIALDGVPGVIDGIRTAVQGLRADLSEHRDAIIIQILAGVNPALAGIYQAVIALDFPGTISGLGDYLGTRLQDIYRILEFTSAGTLVAVDFFNWFQNQSDPDGFYLPPIDTDTDFRLTLIDYFPFSLPRDLYDTINILLGQTPAALGGASARERDLFLQHLNDQPLTAAELARIEPLIDAHILWVTVPQFEITIPMPDFSTSLGSITYTEPEVVFVIDLADYPTMIAIVNWGVYVSFLLGLIFITPRLLTV
ncbi:MAG: hypothetical protein FWC70_12910, partial [Defluviitaleaceae bacterium]|nr:hypothetical protein [Defluviitaleaceae bacterium]